MIISPSSLDTNLSQLLDEVDTGKTQLPEFQRDWTWDDGRICGIIASLSQGYPMGAIMRLQYGNPEIKFKYRTIKGVGELNVVPDFLVLDGQQRLTSIYQSMFSQQPVSTKTEKGKNNIERYYYLSMEKCMDKYEDRIDAVISVPSDRKIKENFDRDVKLDLSTQDKEYEQKMFPVNIIFDSNALLQWQFGYMTYYSGKTDELELLKSFQNEVMNTIVKYKLPVITLDKSTPREAVCKVFENVNTGGVPLTVFELVTATYATQEFDLRKDWKKCRKQIQGIDDTLRTDLLDGIDETTFLTTVTLYTSYVDKQAGKDNHFHRVIEDNSKKYFTEDEWSAYQIIKEFRDNDVWVYEKNQRFYIDLISSDLIRAFRDLSNKRYNKFSLEMESATINAFKNATNANKNHFSGWFVGIWGQYSNSSEIDEQVTMMSLKKLRDDLNFIMQEYKEKNMNIAAMHTQNFIKKLDAIIKPENEDLQTRQVIQ